MCVLMDIVLVFIVKRSSGEKEFLGWRRSVSQLVGGGDSVYSVCG